MVRLAGMWRVVLFGAALAGCGSPRAELYTRPTADPPCDEAARPPESSSCASYADATCAAHADCGEEGWACVADTWDDACGCQQDRCTSDASCGTGVCACAGDDRYGIRRYISECVSGNCQTDADCAEGPCMANMTEACGTPTDQGPPDISGWYCATSKDRCRNHGQCAADEWCVYDMAASPPRWDCVRNLGSSCE